MATESAEPVDPLSDAARLRARAAQGARRVLDDLGHAADDLNRPWPRVEPGVLAEGRQAVDRAAAALRNLLDQLDSEPPTSPQ